MLPAHLLGGIRQNIWSLQLAAQQASWPDSPKESQTTTAFPASLLGCAAGIPTPLCGPSLVPGESAGSMQSRLLAVPQARSHGRWDPSILENRTIARFCWGYSQWASSTQRAKRINASISHARKWDVWVILFPAAVRHSSPSSL